MFWSRALLFVFVILAVESWFALQWYGIAGLGFLLVEWCFCLLFTCFVFPAGVLVCYCRMMFCDLFRCCI